MKWLLLCVALFPRLIDASCAGLSGEWLERCKKAQAQMLRRAHEEFERSKLLIASTPKSWAEPTAPFQIVGPLYYVGTKGIAVYLIKTTKGLILLGGTVGHAGSVISDAIKQLGFKIEDIKLLLVSHSHFDHVATLSYFKNLTQAPVVAMAGDVELLKSGGKNDYLFGADPKFYFDPVTVDRVAKDGEPVELGDITMIPHATAGHTPGCTTWEMKVKVDGKKYNVVFVDGTTVNPGTRLVKEPSYPTILQDYRKTFAVLSALKPDIFLSYHAEVFDMESKRAVAKKAGVKAWVDPKGYEKFVAKKRAEFEKLVKEEGGRASTDKAKGPSHD